MPARYPEAVAGRRRRPTSEDAPLGNKPPMMHTGLFPLACPHPLSACYAGRRRPLLVTFVTFVVHAFGRSPLTTDIRSGRSASARAAAASEHTEI